LPDNELFFITPLDQRITLRFCQSTSYPNYIVITFIIIIIIVAVAVTTTAAAAAAAAAAVIVVVVVVLLWLRYFSFFTFKYL
jgi:quinol-cytochrome oxidoreductase complex cytochrome b subunit